MVGWGGQWLPPVLNPAFNQEITDGNLYTTRGQQECRKKKRIGRWVGGVGDLRKAM